MRPYQHKVQYYETDRMGITHHSNYIRWMEEARVDFLEQLGWGYDRLEALGVGSPVLGVACSYKQPTTFHDTVEVTVCLKEYRGARMTIGYEMRDAARGRAGLHRLVAALLCQRRGPARQAAPRSAAVRRAAARAGGGKSRELNPQKAKAARGRPLLLGAGYVTILSV